MGKRKTPVFRDGSAKQSGEDGKIKAIRTWDDVEHDSEDEFHEEREKILLGEDNDQYEDDESEAEVYGLGSDESEEEEESDEEFKERDGKKSKRAQDDEDEDLTWGRSKKMYYDADEGEDLDEMREEEEEALKIQKQRIAAMDEADFMDDAWVTGAGQTSEVDKQLVDNVSKELDDITFDVSKTAAKRRKNLAVAEKLKILQNESPELLDLLNEFKEKSEVVSDLDVVLERVQSKNATEEKPAKFLRFKHQLLLNYLTNVSFYFVLKASGSIDIQSHPVINALVELRSTLEKTEQVEVKLRSQIDAFIDDLDASSQKLDKPATAEVKDVEHVTKKNNATAKKSKKAAAQEEATVPQFSDEEQEEDLEDDTAITAFDIEEEFKSLKKANKKRKRTAGATDDFGELEALDELDMQDKLAKKRSIRDYVTKIDAKQAKLQAKYQGDSDIPYKDRRQRGEKKGVPQPQDTSADLDNEDYEDDAGLVDEINNTAGGDGDDDYYNQVVAGKAAAKAAKKAEAEANRAPLVEGPWQLEEGEKRLASYKILKNRGLTPRRKKENRNSRVKHRNKYADKLKKLSSTRAVVKPLKGTYGGESTGIKSNVVKSVRF
ncbi:Sas10 C-terminal domain-containing protein [Zychaea mexicana]|uniref:Sas10 C-terminal domain-containing protein n=1 Tax=Zychaea mexicana TaxID=64656 RepID=UPI0022FE456A|nr:Sas10 C-terminal domain-containing protein [Zychaea mexicana]KAI9494651.1 Sas10 C-terminal domain-containing protein [Zychaea mexicana]